MAKATDDDRARGRRDGFNDPVKPKEDGAEYLAGHAEGRADRERAHERMDETCARFRRYDHYERDES